MTVLVLVKPLLGPACVDGSDGAVFVLSICEPFFRFLPELVGVGIVSERAIGARAGLLGSGASMKTRSFIFLFLSLLPKASLALSSNNRLTSFSRSISFPTN